MVYQLTRASACWYLAALQGERGSRSNIRDERSFLNYLLLNALRDARFYTQQSALKAEDIDRIGQDYLMWRELLNRLQRWEGLHDVQERANAGH